MGEAYNWVVSICLKITKKQHQLKRCLSTIWRRPRWETQRATPPPSNSPLSKAKSSSSKTWPLCEARPPGITYRWTSCWSASAIASSSWLSLAINSVIKRTAMAKKSDSIFITSDRATASRPKPYSWRKSWSTEQMPIPSSSGSEKSCQRPVTTLFLWWVIPDVSFGARWPEPTSRGTLKSSSSTPKEIPSNDIHATFSPKTLPTTSSNSFKITIQMHTVVQNSHESRRRWMVRCFIIGCFSHSAIARMLVIFRVWTERPCLVLTVFRTVCRFGDQMLGFLYPVQNMSNEQMDLSVRFSILKGKTDSILPDFLINLNYSKSTEIRWYIFTVLFSTTGYHL